MNLMEFLVIVNLAKEKKAQIAEKLIREAANTYPCILDRQVK